MESMSVEQQGEVWRLSLKGDWSLGAMAGIERDLQQLARPTGDLICDWSGAVDPGVGCAWALLSRLDALGVPAARIRHQGSPPHALALLGTLIAGRDSAGGTAGLPAPAQEGLLGRVGRWAVGEGMEARGVLGFVGRIAAVLGESIRRPRTLRVASIVRHIHETGVTAIPIVSLIAFLISVVVAYLGAQQLSKFGANIFVVDLVGLAVLREMGVLLTAVIVAGRSGSAFAAEIGVMQINEEIDALRAMGMNPFEVLVLPRIIALVIALPALTIVADAVGLAGGGLLSMVELNIQPPQFIARLREAISDTTFWAGLIKAPVFALVIAVTGAYRGMQVRESARELGRLTTVAVVQSIFLVILVDAIFAVIYEQVDF